MQLSICFRRIGAAWPHCPGSRVPPGPDWKSKSSFAIILATRRSAQLIRQFSSDYCNIVVVDPCEPLENTSEILRLAKGEFIFVVGDDDQCFDRAIEAMPGVLEQFGKDRSVVGVTGLYALETSKGSAIFTIRTWAPTTSWRA